MNVDKFGHHMFKRQKNSSQLDQRPIILMDADCLDARNKIIKNVGLPTDPEDCATKKYVDELIEKLNNKIFMDIKSINQAITTSNNQNTPKNLACAVDKLNLNIKTINQTLTQVGAEINSLKQNIETISQKQKKK